MAGNAGAALIGSGLLGGALSGWYVDKSKEFELTAKVSYGMSAVTCCFFAMVSSYSQLQTAEVLNKCVISRIHYSTLAILNS